MMTSLSIFKPSSSSTTTSPTDNPNHSITWYPWIKINDGTAPMHKYHLFWINFLSFWLATCTYMMFFLLTTGWPWTSLPDVGAQLTLQKSIVTATCWKVQVELEGWVFSLTFKFHVFQISKGQGTEQIFPFCDYFEGLKNKMICIMLCN